MGAAIAVSILTAAQVGYGLKSNRLSWLSIFVAGALGLALGEFLDYAAGYRIGLWEYSRHPYWTLSYWAVLPLMWTEFGVGVHAAWKSFRRPALVIPVMMIGYEGYGVLRNSWSYSVDPWIVAMGWIPLILTIAYACDFIVAQLECRGDRNVDR